MALLEKPLPTIPKNSDSVRVDLNADIGESFGIYTTGDDDLLLRSITSGSVACGFHAGDPGVMRHTIRKAAAAGVSIGAHPGFPDLVGFGRREMTIHPDEVVNLVLYQIGALSAIAAAEGAALRHVKPHGALYTMAARRADLADAIARAVTLFDKRLVLVGLPRSQSLIAASRAGISFAAEGFADRTYEPDGTLTPRHVSGSVVTEPARAAEQAVRMVCDGKVIARDGSTVELDVKTVCVHGDTPGAAAIASAVRVALSRAGVTIQAL